MCAFNARRRGGGKEVAALRHFEGEENRKREKRGNSSEQLARRNDVMRVRCSLS